MEIQLTLAPKFVDDIRLGGRLSTVKDKLGKFKSMFGQTNGNYYYFDTLLKKNTKYFAVFYLVLFLSNKNLLNQQSFTLQVLYLTKQAETRTTV